MTYALVIHGGAGAQPAIDYTEQQAHMGALIRRGGAMLEKGEPALDVVAAMVMEMEESGLYVAGKGSAPNLDGEVELDASIMDGPGQRAGAVAAVRNIRHPIAAARAVMENSRHVLLAGRGAEIFVDAQGLERITEPDSYYVDHVRHGSRTASADHGTVGAVALDLSGYLAAATSTGGTFNKRPGRVGDTPIPGAGTWADATVAVSCTGTGEYFTRAATAHDIAARINYGGRDLGRAVDEALGEVRRLGGDGGVIAVTNTGEICMQYNSKGMKRAAVSHNIPPLVRVFEPES